MRGRNGKAGLSVHSLTRTFAKKDNNTKIRPGRSRLVRRVAPQGRSVLALGVVQHQLGWARYGGHTRCVVKSI